MIPAVIVAVYLCIVLYIGIFAFRKGTGSRDDFFVANRSLGPYVFLLAIFGTNMTAFAILGSSGLAYQRGIGVYGLMASASGLVIPLCLFFIGTRLWALGKQFGHVTQVQYFRDRWECSHIGTVIFAMSGTWWLYDSTAALAPKPGQPMHEIFPMLGRMFLRSPSNVLVYGSSQAFNSAISAGLRLRRGGMYPKSTRIRMGCACTLNSGMRSPSAS